MKRRNFILLLGGASSGAMSVGTGAFSSMEAERNVSVNVEDDEDAYIRYETPSDDKPVEYGEQVTLVRVRNQFGGNQELALVGVEYGYEDEDREDDVLGNVAVERYDSPAAPDETLSDGDFTAVDEDHVAIERGSTNGSYPAANDDDAFGPGEWVRIVADAHVPTGESPDIEVTITIEGVEGGISAQLFGETRSFELRRAESDPEEFIDRVQFPGQSRKVKIKTESGNGGGGNRDVTATAYYLTGTSVKRTGEETVTTGGNLKLEDDFGVSESGSIVGISIAGISGVFVHPDFEKSGCDLPDGGGSSGNGRKVYTSSDLPTEDEAFGSCLEGD